MNVRLVKSFFVSWQETDVRFGVLEDVSSSIKVDIHKKYTSLSYG